MSNYNTQLQSNNTDLQSILETVNTLPESTGEQLTPAISVNSATGLITAVAGTKLSTHQLAFQSAKTITPTTEDQIAVPSGYFTGGSITVKGDSNLVAGNIRNGATIFGVNGTAGDTSIEDGLVKRSLSNYTNNRISYIGAYAFYSCANLTNVSFQACTLIDARAFYNCSHLTNVSFPACISIGAYAFTWGLELTSIYLTNSSICTLAASNAFSQTGIWSTKGSIYVPSSLVASYKTATNWAFFSARIFSAP